MKKIVCTAEKTKSLFEVTERLMKKANIELRDTWDGYDGENYDNLFANGGRTDGPKLFEVYIVADGVPRLTTKSYTLPGYKSQAFEKATLLIPFRRARDINPVIHEIVHFLQHSTEEMDKAWNGMKSQSVEDFRRYADQRAEQEAFFVQLLYINEFENPLTDDKELQKEFKCLLERALTDVNLRTDFIVFAKSVGVV